MDLRIRGVELLQLDNRCVDAFPAAGDGVAIVVGGVGEILLQPEVVEMNSAGCIIHHRQGSHLPGHQGVGCTVDVPDGHCQQHNHDSKQQIVPTGQR